MAEMLVRLYDKYTGKDPVTLAKTTKRGDVIVVQDDGWPWSPAERKSPDWIIISVNMPLAKAQAMLAPEQGDPIKNPLLQLRAFKVDLDALTVLGYPILTSKDAMLAKFPLSPKGQQGNVKDPVSADPMAEITASLQTGDRFDGKDLPPDTIKRPSEVQPILEVHFDATKTVKTPIVDAGKIGEADAGVIG